MATDADYLYDLFRRVQSQGLENTLQVYYSFYQAEVMTNEDPEGRGRIKANVVELSPAGGEPLDVWIPPFFMGAGKQRGFFSPPEKGDFVRVMFHHGDMSNPRAYLGGWYGTDEVPKEFGYTNKRPEKRGFVTRMGHGVVFSEENDNMFVRIFWHKPKEGDPALSDASVTASRDEGDFSFIELTKDGSVQISNKDGSLINLDAVQKAVQVLSSHGHGVSITEDGITLSTANGEVLSLASEDLTAILGANGQASFAVPTVIFKSSSIALGENASFAAVLGEKLIQWLNTHTHSTGVGPSGPPVVPAIPVDLLSRAVKLRA